MQYLSHNFVLIFFSLCNHGGGSGRLVLPVGRKLTGGPVVPRKAVDTRLNENKTELGVLVLTVLLQMLTDLDGLLDKHVQILGDFGSKAVGLEDADNLLSSDGAHLGDTVRVTKNDSNLGRGQTLLGKLAHMVLNISRADLQPRRRGPLVRNGGLGNTLTGCVHTSHATKRQTMIDRKSTV
jgi:hypothetical protein